MSESGASGLLVTVKISGPQGIATRNLYHIPRVGDHVSFPADDHVEGETYWIVVGTVTSVLWTDDAIFVSTSMGKELDDEMLKLRGLN